MRKLYLHIGNHRTATSSVQGYLRGNFPGLVEQGFLYPYKERRHFRVMNQLFSGVLTAEKLAKDLENRAATKKREIHSIVLSDEDICSRADLSPLAELRETFDVKIVFALRRQDLWLESWYLQNVKWQWNPAFSHCSFEEFLEKRSEFFWIDYDKHVEQLATVFGEENVLLYVYEKEQMPNGPIQAFCDRIELNDTASFYLPEHVNSSMSPLVSEFMRSLPLDEAPPKYRSQLEHSCKVMESSLGPKFSTDSKLLLDAETRTQIMESYATGNEKLAKRYFDRDRLFLEPLPAENELIPNRTLPQDSYELMKHFVTPFLRNLIKLNVESELKQKND